MSAAANSVASSLGARFLQQRLLRDLPHNSAPQRIAVAYSGGADSAALVHMAAAWARDAPGRSVLALHVDHRVRAESTAEQQRALSLLQQQHQQQAISVEPLTVHWRDGVPPTIGHVQKQCREQRYSLLDAACRRHRIDTLLTAHHLNDQAETLLLRLSRSSTLRGLAAMHALTPLVDHGPAPHVVLWRPLLDVRKDDLVAYCRLHALDWIHDPSNDKLEFRRVYARHLVHALERDFHTPLSAFGDVARAAGVLDLALDRAADDFLRLVTPESGAGDSAAASITQRRCSVDVALFFGLPAPVAVRVLQRFEPTATNGHATNFIKVARNGYAAFLQTRRPSIAFHFNDLFSLRARRPSARTKRGGRF